MRDMGIYIAVTVILLLMNGFFFYVFKGILTRLKRFSQNNLLRQAGVFDELIQNKQEELLVVQKMIQDENEAGEALPNQVRAIKTAEAPDYLKIKQGSYRDSDFTANYRHIRQSFDFDREACVRSVAASLPPHDPAEACRALLGRFSLEDTYQLSTLEAEQQLGILADVLNAQEADIVKQYSAGAERFEFYEFLAWLESRVFELSGEVIVRTGRQDESYDGIDRRVRTEYDQNVCEGIYIVTGGRIYDFSLRDREIGR